MPRLPFFSAPVSFVVAAVAAAVAAGGADSFVPIVERRPFPAPGAGVFASAAFDLVLVSAALDFVFVSAALRFGFSVVRDGFSVVVVSLPFFAGDSFGLGSCAIAAPAIASEQAINKLVSVFIV